MPTLQISPGDNQTKFRITPFYTSIRALASARGSVVTKKKKKKKKKKRARSLEGPKGPRVAETCESEGPKGPRTS